MFEMRNFDKCRQHYRCLWARHQLQMHCALPFTIGEDNYGIISVIQNVLIDKQKYGTEIAITLCLHFADC